MKALPEKERYKINVIPCNTEGLTKRQMTKAKSAEDVESAVDRKLPHELEEDDDIPIPIVKVTEIQNSEDKGSKVVDNKYNGASMLEKLGTVIASRARTVERKQKKMKSYIDIKIGAESFISEKTGKFSDYYKTISRIGEGGYGQVFKVQHKKSSLIRAMKSRLY